MPIEIRELVIRTTVTGGAGNAETSSGSAQAASAGVAARIDREKLVAECVEQVMEILREERER
jgi:hypothetical protein